MDDTPIVLFVYNRPHLVERVMASIRSARPRRLVVVADGPRPEVPGDATRCADARRIATTVDWRGEVELVASDANLGCDRRLDSGLDRVFSQVDRAIVLEDDTVPDPAFFPWCTSMLDRYDGDPTIGLVAGRNELARWPPGGEPTAHFTAARAPLSAWATWASQWRELDRTLTIDPADLSRRLGELPIDPLVREHVVVHVGVHADGRRALTGWDVRTSFAQILAGQRAVVASSNLVTNVGFGPGASHTNDPDDLRAAVGVVADSVGGGPSSAAAVPERTDRWGLLVELMASFRDLATVRRLALLAAGPAGDAIDPLVRHQLSPALVPAESLAIVDHLAGCGVASPRLDALRHLFVDLAGRA
jgi:hypothetical protein